MRLNGSELVMEVLLEHGVDTVFGYPGGAALKSMTHSTSIQTKSITL